MATRLIRKVCDHCKQKYNKVSKEQMAILDIKPKDLEGKTLYTQGSGCEHCVQTGYSGRLPIHELLVMDDPIRDLLMKTQDATAIRKLAVQGGMRSLRESAVAKVLEGLTSIEEAISKTQTEELEV
jgi:general secretion pathway protein E